MGARGDTGGASLAPIDGARLSRWGLQELSQSIGQVFEQALAERTKAEVDQEDFTAEREVFQKRSLQPARETRIEHADVDLEVHAQRHVVEVEGPDRAPQPVDYRGFGVQHTLVPLEYAHAGPQQPSPHGATGMAHDL